MILVEIYCKAKGCDKLLATVSKRPKSFEGTLHIPVCKRHGGIRRGHFLSWARGQARAGRQPPFMWTYGHNVLWTDLLPAIEKAERVGRPSVETV